MSRSRALVSGLVALVLVASAGALAQSVIAHEFVPNAGEDDGSSLVSSSGSAEPAAILYDGALVPPPSGGALRDGERAMRALPGDGTTSEEVGRRSPTFRPDRVTALPGAISYFEIFTPSITPYKRVTALDGVALAGSVPVLAVADGARSRVPVEGAGASAPDGRARDRFWGSVVLDFSDGSEVPLPSVSPESRILTLRTEPANVALHVERDHADNFFAVLDAPATHEVRVIFLTDAPRTYFGFDDGAVLPTAPSDALVAEVPVLPESVERDALDFARELGLGRGDPFDRVLGTLVAHFRAFEESEEPPADSGNIFLDLARGMRGVCRHRAYAFAILAMALGIPTRFVNNEAHAWVEVHMPERRGWLRVDLGGSAQGLVSRSADRGPEYQPDVRDLLPRPEPYERALTNARATSQAPEHEAAASSTAASEGSDTTTAVGTTVAPSHADPLGLAPTPPSAPARAPLALSIDHDHWDVLRGQSFEVTGTATSRGSPAEGVRIEVLLRDAQGAEQLLGVTVSGANGVFHASFGVPPDAQVGERALVVRSPASTRFQAASVD